MVRKRKAILVLIAVLLGVCSLFLSVCAEAAALPEMIPVENGVIMMDNRYITEAVRFSVPYGLSSYLTAKMSDGYLFVKGMGESLYHFVKFGPAGEPVFGLYSAAETEKQQFPDFAYPSDPAQTQAVYRMHALIGEINYLDQSESGVNRLPVYEDSRYYYFPAEYRPAPESAAKPEAGSLPAGICALVRIDKVTGLADHDYCEILAAAAISDSSSGSGTLSEYAFAVAPIDAVGGAVVLNAVYTEESDPAPSPSDVPQESGEPQESPVKSPAPTAAAASEDGAQQPVRSGDAQQRTNRTTVIHILAAWNFTIREDGVETTDLLRWSEAGAAQFPGADGGATLTLNRMKTVTHEAVYHNGIIYLTEGAYYRASADRSKPNGAAAAYVKGTLYAIAADGVRSFSLNSLVSQAHSVPYGEYYAVNLLPMERGMGILFNYYVLETGDVWTYRYYTTAALLEYSDFSVIFQSLHEEVEKTQTGGAAAEKYFNHIDLLEINGFFATVSHYHKESEDVLFPGAMIQTELVLYDEPGTPAAVLTFRNGLGFGEVRYGNTFSGNTIGLYDRIPPYDPYAGLDPETEVDFVEAGYGPVGLLTGIEALRCKTGDVIHVLDGVMLRDKDGAETTAEGLGGTLYVEYGGNRLQNGIFRPAEAGTYTFDIVFLLDGEGVRAFRTERTLIVTEKAVPPTNPSTGNPALPVLSAFVLWGFAAGIQVLRQRKSSFHKSGF